MHAPAKTVKDTSAPRRKMPSSVAPVSSATSPPATDLHDLDPQVTSAGKDVPADPSALLTRTMVRHIQRIAARVRTASVKSATMHGLHVADMYALTVLLRSPPDFSARASDLKNTLSYTSGGMTKRIDRLEQQHLVVRVADPSDRRAWMIRLTAKGKALAEKITEQGRRKGVLVGVADVFDDQELQSFVGLLERLDAALDSSGYPMSEG